MTKPLPTRVLRASAAWCVLIALLVGGWSAASASELRPTEDFADVAEVVNRYADEFGPENVLLVLDIDNTIMSMNHDLGSDHWFEWQNYLLENEPHSAYLVADDFDGLLEVQGILYNLSHMHPPEPEQPAIIAKLQGRGVATIILTSRGPEFRVATERELKRCGYDIASNGLPVKDVPGGLYYPYDPAKPKQNGLTREEVEKFELGSPRPVSYANGIFMTAGQHKGMLLLTLLKQSTREINAIVYVDDNVRHVGNVFSAAVDRNLEVTTFHYLHEDTRVQRFQYGDKRDVTQRWHRLRDTIEAVFD